MPICRALRICARCGCPAARRMIASAAQARGPAVALLAVAIVCAAAGRAATVIREAENPPLMTWFNARAAASAG